MGAFADQLKAFGEKAMANANEAVRLAIVETGQRMIDRSPIDTGRFKSNWNFGLQTPDRHTTQTTSVRTINNLEEMPAKIVGHISYVTNSLPYARALEYGHSKKQAPQGMVRLTVVEWSQILDDAARKVAAA